MKEGKRTLDALIKGYMKYLDTARTPSMAVKAAAGMLDAAGFVRYYPEMPYGALWKERAIRNVVGRYGIYFIDRNNVNIAAVKLGRRHLFEGMNIAGAHVDFCTLTNKVVSAIEKKDGVYLDTRPYGGFYPHQWMDRPLRIIGQTLAKRRQSSERDLIEWETRGHIPEASIHNPNKLTEKKYTEAFTLEKLDIFTGYKTIQQFISALNDTTKEGSPRISIEDFNSGFTSFHAVPDEPTHVLGDYIAGYGHDNRSCMFAALKALIETGSPEYTAAVLGVSREEIGSDGVGSANDVFLNSVIKAMGRLHGVENDADEIFLESVMLSADVDIAYNSQNEEVSDEKNCAQFGEGAALVIANGRDGNPTGNIVMPSDLYFIERFLAKRELAYQVTALPSKVGIGGGGGTIAQYYSHKGILTADLGIPVGNMHGTVSRIYAADLDSTVEAFKALFQREEKRQNWG